MDSLSARSLLPTLNRKLTPKETPLCADMNREPVAQPGLKEGFPCDGTHDSNRQLLFPAER